MPTKLSPQPIIESSLAAALLDGCDCVQHKFNGQWVRVEVSKGYLRMYDPEESLVESDLNHIYDVPDSVCGSFIGNLTYGHTKVYLWDCWYVCGQGNDGLSLTHHDLSNYQYRDRYAILTNEWKKLMIGATVPTLAKFKLVRNHPIAQATAMWNVLDEPDACGLVFRNSKSKLDTAIRIARRYREIPRELR